MGTTLHLTPEYRACRPVSTWVRRVMVLSLQKLGRDRHAEVWLRRIVRSYPGDTSSLKVYARVLRRTGKKAEMVDVWRQIHSAQPDDPEPILEIGRQFYREAAYEDALHWFRKLLDSDPQHLDGLRSTGRALVRLNQWNEACEVWTRLHSLTPQLAEPAFQAGRCMARLGRPSDAEHWFNKALALAPGHIETARALGRELINAKRYADALRLWRTTAEAHPEDGEAAIQIGRCLAALGEEEEAVAHLRGLAENVRTAQDATRELARFMARRHRWTESMALWKKLAGLAPTSAVPWFEMGRVHEALHDTDAAVDCLKTALSLDRHHAPTWRHLAKLEEAVGSLAQATVSAREFVRCAPEDAEGWRRLARLLRLREAHAEIEEVMAEASAALAGSSLGEAKLGRVAESAGKLDVAEEYFGFALERGTDPRAMLLAARFLRSIGKLGEAHCALLKAIEQFPLDVDIKREHEYVLRGLELLGCSADLHAGPSCRSVRGILVPEAAFDVLTANARARLASSLPVPGRVIIVARSLGIGGGERQLVNTVVGLLTSQAHHLESVTLLCEELGNRDGRDHAAYLPELQALPVEVLPYRVPCNEAEARELVDADDMALIDLLPSGLKDRTLSLLCGFLHWRPQVVHAWRLNLAAGLAAALAGVPRIIMCERSMSPKTVNAGRHGRTPRYMREGYRALLRLPNVQLVCNCEAGADDYARWLGMDDERPGVLLNGIDCAIKTPRTYFQRHCRDAINFSPQGLLVGSAFRITEEKRPFLWVAVAREIANRVPEARFLVIGSGPLADAMLRRADELGLRDTLRVVEAKEDALSWIAAMDVLLLVSRVEGLPNVLLEAQACGVPVVATDVGGVRETLVEGVSGYAVREDSPRVIADRVVGLLHEPRQKLNERGQTGRNFVLERFSLDRMVRETVDLYGLSGFTAAHRPEPTIAAAILFHNRADQTEACIRSLLESGIRIHVLNNGSDPDETAKLLALCRGHSQIAYRDAGANLGVGPGRNMLIKSSSEQWLLFLDNDITVQTGDWLARLHRHIRANADIEVFLPALYNVLEQRWVARSRLAVDGENHVVKATATNIKGMTNRFSGGASVVSRSLFERLGLYDEKMFVGYEDVELAVRAMMVRQPVRAMYVDDIRLIHDHQAAKTDANISAARTRYDAERITVSANRLAEKHGVTLGHDFRPWIRKQLHALIASDNGVE